MPDCPTYFLSMLTEAPGISVFNAESSAFTMYLTLLPNVTGGEIVTKSCAARETGHVADVADGGDRHRSSSEAKQRTALPILVVAVRAIKGRITGSGATGERPSESSYNFRELSFRYRRKK